MPIHDWTRVDAGTFHSFHQGWAIRILDALNDGLLPAGYEAFTDVSALGYEPDLIAVEVEEDEPLTVGGVAVAEAPSRALLSGVAETERAAYARRANRVAVKNRRGRIVAMLEIVSPGNKDSGDALDAFTGKIVTFLQNRVNALVIDIFPRTRRDPNGIHRLIRDRVGGGPFEEGPADKPLTVASYDAGPPMTAYVDPLAVGDPLPAAELFIAPGRYIALPLETTYQDRWGRLPASVRRDLETPS